MVDEAGFQEEPLDFSKETRLCRCPYCGETLGADELDGFLAPESNTFVCPNCRKKLNIHELGNAVKPVIFTGESLEVKLIREGKESGQALAYMEDGTMIVVSDARHLIGKTATVLITSVLQTQAGKMIFAKIG